MKAWLKFLFTTHREQVNDDHSNASLAPEMPQVKWDGSGCTPLTVQDYLEPQLQPDLAYRKIVRNTRSFADLLAPRIDLGDGNIGLQDLTSVGRIYEITCGNTEAIGEDALTRMQEHVHQAIARSFPEHDLRPWIMQWFVQDSNSGLTRAIHDQLLAYTQDVLLETRFTRHWFDTVAEHFDDLTRPGGLFPNAKSKTVWRAKSRRVLFCIWRKALPQQDQESDTIDQICSRLRHSLAEAQIRLTPVSAKSLYEWLTHWFVPKPDTHTGYQNTFELLDAHPWPEDQSSRAMALYSGSASADISRAALHGVAPWTWKKPGIWWFRGQPSRFITIDELTGEPDIGHLTAERQFGDSQATFWDQMPAGAIWSMSVVISPQENIRAKISKVKENSVGDDAAAVERRKLAACALGEIVKGNPIYRVFAGVFVFGKNLTELNRNTERALSLLAIHRLRPVVPRYDPIALDSYIRALPFGYDAKQDSHPATRRSRLWYSSHVSRVAPVFGRSTGTGAPGCLLFNRGAQPLMFDPLNPQEREKNAHSLILGPTGSGKTALLIYLLLQLLAVHRPRVVLISALSTFGLFADHCHRQGLSVNHFRVDGKRNAAVPPFRHAQDLLNQDHGKTPGADKTYRDLLGEMEIQARLMITGGQPNEEKKLRRDDIDLIRSALVEAARRAQLAGRQQTLTSDLVDALYHASSSGQAGRHRLSKRQRQRAAQMAGACNIFCTGLNGRLFDSEGEPWPQTDITVVELDLLARRGYEDRLAVALTGLFSSINNQIEHNQYRSRQTIVVIDEAHILLQNPLIAPYINRICAMWRTFGAWLWIATQGIRQFPDNAKELLNQPEWWYCLSMDEDEIKQIERFKSLSRPQRDLLLRARKEPGRYTEGTLISPRLVTLFRNVPPALALALSQTEKNEKAARAQLMEERKISEIEAAYLIAESIRTKRSQTA